MKFINKEANAGCNEVLRLSKKNEVLRIENFVTQFLHVIASEHIIKAKFKCNIIKFIFHLRGINNKLN